MLAFGELSTNECDRENRVAPSIFESSEIDGSPVTGFRPKRSGQQGAIVPASLAAITTLSSGFILRLFNRRSYRALGLDTVEVVGHRVIAADETELCGVPTIALPPSVVPPSPKD